MTHMNTMRSIINSHTLLDHPFYVAWSTGALKLNDIAYYAVQWSLFEGQFTRYISKTHAQCDALAARKVLANNLVDEEGLHDYQNGRQHPSHVELWADFARSIGVSDAALSDARPNPQTAHLMDTYADLCANHGWKAGVCALAAYEEQAADVAKFKLDALENVYQFSSEKTLGFFRLHQNVDKWHAHEWAQMIDRHFEPTDEVLALQATERAAAALYGMLDGVVNHVH